MRIRTKHRGITIFPGNLLVGGRKYALILNTKGNLKRSFGFYTESDMIKAVKVGAEIHSQANGLGYSQAREKMTLLFYPEHRDKASRAIIDP
jgi:hypothetical protein